MTRKIFGKRMLGNETNLILTLLAFGILTLYFTFPQPNSMSIYNFEAPVFTVGDTAITRGDLYYTLDILSITSFAVAFLLLMIKKIRTIKTE